MYPIVIFDALRVKIRDADGRMVNNKAVYIALGVTREGEREVLGLWIADNEGEPCAPKGGRGRLIGRTKGGLNSKLHVLADARGRPIRMFLSAGQTSDYIGARALLSSIPQARALLADRGYDADRFRNALIGMGISPCIPSRIGRKAPIQHDADLYRQRHKIENMFARLKDWRRIATRYDRCPILFLWACALAATVIYWL